MFSLFWGAHQQDSLQMNLFSPIQLLHKPSAWALSALSLLPCLYTYNFCSKSLVYQLSLSQKNATLCLFNLFFTFYPLLGQQYQWRIVLLNKELFWWLHWLLPYQTYFSPTLHWFPLYWIQILTKLVFSLENGQSYHQRWDVWCLNATSFSRSLALH